MKLIGVTCEPKEELFLKTISPNLLMRLFKHPPDEISTLPKIIKLGIPNTNTLLNLSHYLKKDSYKLGKQVSTSEQEFNNLNLGSELNTNIYVGNLTRHNSIGWITQPAVIIPDSKYIVDPKIETIIQNWSKQYKIEKSPQ